MDFYDEEMERMKRDKNFFQMKMKMAQMELDKLKVKYEYTKGRDATLTAFENSLPQRIETYKKKNAPSIIVDELTLLYNMLMEEKRKLLEKDKIEE